MKKIILLLITFCVLSCDKNDSNLSSEYSNKGTLFDKEININTNNRNTNDRVFLDIQAFSSGNLKIKLKIYHSGGQIDTKELLLEEKEYKRKIGINNVYKIEALIEDTAANDNLKLEYSLIRKDGSDGKLYAYFRYVFPGKWGKCSVFKHTVNIN